MIIPRISMYVKNNQELEEVLKEKKIKKTLPENIRIVFINKSRKSDKYVTKL